MKRKATPIDSDAALAKDIAAADRKIARAVAQGDKAIARAVAAEADDTPNGAKSSPCAARRCGAKTRSGGRCRSAAIAGKKRCRMHGGAHGSGGQRGNSNARKAGIYSDVLSAEDIEALSLCKVGSLDDEIGIARIQLRRALAEQTRQDASAGILKGFEVDELKVSIGPAGCHTEVRRVRRDYGPRIRQLLRLIADLELRRQLLAAAGAATNDPNEIAQRIQAALEQIDAVSSGAADAGAERGADA